MFASYIGFERAHSNSRCLYLLRNSLLQAVKTAPELALQLRKLDSNVQWEALKRPLGEDFPYASAEILDRRPASPSTDSAAASPTAAATASASASATNGSNPDDAAATGLTGRWEYLLQSSHGEVLPDGLGSAQHAQRQPLQPLSQLQGQLQQPQGLLQQPQVEKTQALADTFATQFQQSGLNSVGNAHLQQQQQHPQHMSVLPNDAVAQQQQQAAGPPADKQIAVQKAVSLLSSHELPEQAQLAAQSANGVPAEDSTAGQITAEQKNAAHQSADGTAALHDSAQRAQHVEQAHVASTVPNGQQQPQLPSAPLHDPSATPYAPVANGMPQPSGLLASLVPALSQRPLSAGAATADRLGQLAPALPQGFANSPALSREGTPAVKPQPLWVHEDKLPLWLVKAYEEKRRRDVSMVAARAAQQAQRDANAANRGSTASFLWSLQ